MDYILLVETCSTKMINMNINVMLQFSSSKT